MRTASRGTPGNHPCRLPFSPRRLRRSGLLVSAIDAVGDSDRPRTRSDRYFASIVVGVTNGREWNAMSLPFFPNINATTFRGSAQMAETRASKCQPGGHVMMDRSEPLTAQDRWRVHGSNGKISKGSLSNRALTEYKASVAPAPFSHIDSSFAGPRRRRLVDQARKRAAASAAAAAMRRRCRSCPRLSARATSGSTSMRSAR